MKPVPVTAWVSDSILAFHSKGLISQSPKQKIFLHCRNAGKFPWDQNHLQITDISCQNGEHLLVEKIQEASLVYLPANVLLFLISVQRLHYVQSTLVVFSDSLDSYLEVYFLGVKCSLHAHVCSTDHPAPFNSGH